MEYNPHLSVLKDECLDFLTPSSLNEICYFADMTFGAGGHSLALLQKFPKSHVIAVDQDNEAYQNGQKLIAEKNLTSHLSLLHMNFLDFSFSSLNNFPQVKEKGGFAGILCDLGVSSHHFDSAQRGFSFRQEGLLDMRMNQSKDKITAADLVNGADEEELTRILYIYGEERYAKKIARNIVNQRKKLPFKTTKDLENLVFHSYPEKDRHRGTHPATRTFQALRIAVNEELDVLEKSIPKLFEMLAPEGKLAIISFHSLEDRIVKQGFKNLKSLFSEEVEILTKKPIIPTEQEILNNNRARSAKLRVIKKVN
ncbi:MAG: 16S rRNA (cytosine(1402)-N(4))-methyltransferase RsmH [Bacteriovoracaceae bacterium]|nr:16S rRNA (cytosine(1402)-N(4))-methyltransferase RsmH [Bacteriovoracaceae bacterium]